MTQNRYMQLAEYPQGDYEEGSIEDGDVEEGDIYEQGGQARRKAARVSNKPQTVARRSAKIVRASATSPVAKVPVAPNDPNVMKAAALKDAIRRPDIVYLGMKGARLISASIGSDAVMRQAEHDAIKSAIFEAVPFQPVTFGFTAGVLSADSALSTTNGGPLANTTSFRYAGSAITLAASVLNATPGAPVSLTIGLGAGQTLTVLFEIQEGVYAVDLTILHAVMIAGKPRFYAPFLAVAAAASGNYNVTFSNLPTNYTPILRFLQPGDDVVDRFLALL